MTFRKRVRLPLCRLSQSIYIEIAFDRVASQLLAMNEALGRGRPDYSAYYTPLLMLTLCNGCYLTTASVRVKKTRSAYVEREKLAQQQRWAVCSPSTGCSRVMMRLLCA